MEDLPTPERAATLVINSGEKPGFAIGALLEAAQFTSPCIAQELLDVIKSPLLLHNKRYVPSTWFQMPYSHFTWNNKM